MANLPFPPEQPVTRSAFPSRLERRPNRALALLRCVLEGTRLSLHPDWLIQRLRFGHRRRIEGGLSPGDREWKLGVIDDTSVAAVTAQVEIRAHEDTIDRARFD